MGGIAIFPGISAQIYPALTSRIVVTHPISRAIRQRRQITFRSQIRSKPRLREHRNAGCAACFSIDHDLLLKAVRAGILHIRAGGGFEIVDDAFHQFLVRAKPRAKDGDRLARQIHRLQRLKAIPGKRPVPWGKLQMPVGKSSASRQGERGSACVKHVLHNVLPRHFIEPDDDWAGKTGCALRISKLSKAL